MLLPLLLLAAQQLILPVLGASPCFTSISVKCPVCSICTCRATTVNCQRRGLTEVPEGIPVATRFLNLEENSIIELEEDAFEGLAQLRTINLFGNRILEIHPNAFQAANRTLEQLFLYHNQLKLFPPGLLRGFGSLQKLRFDKNYVEDLPYDAFYDLHSLRELDFSSNAIRHMGFSSRKMFQSQSQLERLIMDNIPCPTHWPGDTYSTGVSKEVSDASGASWRSGHAGTGGINPIRNSVNRPCMWHLKSVHFCGVPANTHILVNGAKFLRGCAPISCDVEECPIDEEILSSRKVNPRRHPSTFVIACFMVAGTVLCVLAVMAISGSRLKQKESSIA